MVMKFLRASWSWLKENAIGIFLALLTITINLPRLSEVFQPVWLGVYEFLGAVAPLFLLVLIFSAVVAVGWLITWIIKRVIWPPIVQAAKGVVGRHLVNLNEEIDGLKRARAVIERKLRIGNYPELNLPDNLPPDSIKLEIQRYEREKGVRNLWRAVERSMGESRTGYVVVEHEESGGRESTSATYFDTRSQAERKLGEGKVLIHVIESDWRSENGHLVTLDIGPGGHRLDDAHRERRPGFTSVDHKPDGSCTFRLKLREEGKDESTGRKFDWWFEQLQNAREQNMSAGMEQKPEIVIQDTCLDGNKYYQIQYVGFLKGPPRRHASNSSLFEFSLLDVVVTRTWWNR